MAKIGSRIPRAIKPAAAAIIAVCVLAPAFAWQTHRAGTKGPETPPLQGAGRWHYLAPLPYARSEVAVAETNGKVYVLGGYATALSTSRSTKNTIPPRTPGADARRCRAG